MCREHQVTVNSLPGGKYLFKAFLLHHSCSAQKSFCLHVVLSPLENFVMQAWRILFWFWPTVCALSVLLFALKNCAMLVSHHLSLIFTFPLKRDKRYCIMLTKLIFFQEITEFQIAKLKIQKGFSIILKQLLGIPLNICRILVSNGIHEVSVLIRIIQTLQVSLQKTPQVIGSKTVTALVNSPLPTACS